MSRSSRKKGVAAMRPPRRASSVRQRLRLINACISALHIHGPSRTTVEKVVAIAGMSPGIVRFYFSSKASMLVAALEYLSAEFEQRVLVPVAGMRAEPARALGALVDLYLDPDIASPRKVSVWYSFWGEASSRQEYYDICGQKDARFAELVRELVGRLVRERGATHLDPDGVALGLIGVLEMMWQDFAFQSESQIDRPLARRRCLAYLQSVFPDDFGGVPRAPAAAGADGPVATGHQPAHLAATPAQAPAQWPGGTWQVVAHESQLAPGACFATDLCGERVLLVRDDRGELRAFRNECSALPHPLEAHGSRRLRALACPVHGRAWALDGVAGDGSEPLGSLPLHCADGLVLVRIGRAGQPLPPPALDWGPSAAGASGVALREREVEGDWRALVEHWLRYELPEHPLGRLAGILQRPARDIDARSARVQWRAEVAPDATGWTAGSYARIARAVQAAGPAPGAAPAWHRLFLPPNQVIERRADGATLLQALPLPGGRTRLRWLEMPRGGDARELRALGWLARRMRREWLRQDQGIVEATHSLRTAGDAAVSEPVAAFRAAWTPRIAAARGANHDY